MLLQKLALAAILFFAVSMCCSAQTAPKTISAKPVAGAVRSSPAYAELLLRKVERESELEALTLDYTDEFPKIKEFKYELDLVNREMNRLLIVSAADAGKLTLALGKLMVRKTEVEIELWELQMQYKEENAEIKRTKRKIAIFDKAIREILP